MSRRGEVKEEDFGELLVDGLSSNRSYIVLKTKNRPGVRLQFKPQLHRMTHEVIYLGGKLSVFGKPDSKFVQLESDKEQEEILSTSFQNLPHDRVNSTRCGSNAGYYVLAPSNTDPKDLIGKFNKSHLIHQLLKGIEEAMGTELEHPDEVKAYLTYRYRQSLPGFFSSSEKGPKTPPRLLGKHSELLLGQAFADSTQNDSYVGFLKAVGIEVKTSHPIDHEDSDESDESDED